MNKISQFVRNGKAALLALVIAIGLLGANTASAAVDAGITEMIADVNSVFSSYKTYALLVVGFIIVLGVVKWFRRK